MNFEGSITYLTLYNSFDYKQGHIMEVIKVISQVS